MNTSAETFPALKLNSRLFSEEHMYTFIRSSASSKKLFQTSLALPFMMEKHKGQYRKGKDKIPYVYHPLMMACHAFALGIDEDEVIATILLHDVCEDCGVSPKELPVNDTIKEAVSLLTFSVFEGQTKEEAKKIYYQTILSNRIASIVKVLDRCNNISTMATGFTRERMILYIEETETYIFPILDRIKTYYPQYYNASFLLKYQMRSILETIKRLV